MAQAASLALCMHGLSFAAGSRLVAASPGSWEIHDSYRFVNYTFIVSNHCFRTKRRFKVWIARARLPPALFPCMYGLKWMDEATQFDSSNNIEYSVHG